MASKGSLYLRNDILEDIYDGINSMDEEMEDAFYDQWKKTYKIANSIYFRGDYADAFKSYITQGTLNILTEFMDVSADMKMIMKLICGSFWAYESSSSGRVSENALDYIESGLKTRQNTFNDIKDELNTVKKLASEYITTKSYGLSTVTEGYSAVKSLTKSIRNDLYDVDDSCLESAEELLERITNLKKLIKNMMSYFYDGNGNIDLSGLDEFANQSWYYNAGNIALYLKLQEDPFEYAAGEVTVSEEQWATGLCSDVYAYLGYTFLSASGEAGIEDGTAYATGSALILSGNAYAQVTEYLKGQAEVKVVYAEGSAKVGISDNYVGFSLSGWCLQRLTLYWVQMN